MLKYIRIVLSTLFILMLSILVGCSDPVAESGDRAEGKGTITIAQNGEITGRVNGDSHSRQHGDRHDDDDEDDDEHPGQNGSRLRLNNSTDKIVCTSSNGAVSVHGRGETVTKTATSNCVVTPASQVPTTAGTSGGSGSSSSGSTGTTTGTGTTTAASGTTTSSNPANSF